MPKARKPQAKTLQKKSTRVKVSAATAGRKGGRKMAQTHDVEYFHDIGELGGKARKEVLGHEGYVDMGRKGGRKTAETHDSEFFEDIGKRGGEARKEELGHAGYVALGRKGGEAVKEKYGPEFYSEIGRKGGRARSGVTSKTARKQVVGKPGKTETRRAETRKPAAPVASPVLESMTDMMRESIRWNMSMYEQLFQMMTYPMARFWQRPLT